MTIEKKEKTMPDGKRLICRVPERMAEEFEANCKAEGETMSVIFRRLVRSYNAKFKN